MTAELAVLARGLPTKADYSPQEAVPKPAAS